MPLDAFSAAKLKAELEPLDGEEWSARPDRAVETVAVCSGSGASLMAAAIATGAQAYVSGDLGYHTARDAQQAGIGLIDIGHFRLGAPGCRCSWQPLIREICHQGLGA
jgi:putative NIF3 family GTP cyclohydrolase 1 type 2